MSSAAKYVLQETVDSVPARVQSAAVASFAKGDSAVLVTAMMGVPGGRIRSRRTISMLAPDCDTTTSRVRSRSSGERWKRSSDVSTAIEGKPWATNSMCNGWSAWNEEPMPVRTTR